ncbi:hypothetical protein SAMN05443665_1006139 [Actinomadura meyerae]|uniref:Polyketide cyclase / dehydrase and lipid transport n=1 Tax=Actinomadura meyerae TaxID=240840 RepID=A0A239FRC3_9ACTN|nr:SRPBCC family protein [Actinomadura meyerae]SNS59400.1 hypothetical protein SAMN05443665_1006139 [Actinomadura meyerae]
MNDPVAGIDPLDRLDILAAAMPGAAVVRRRLAAPFEDVWQVIANLEDNLHRFEPGVARVHITERRGEFLSLRVRHTDGREEAMDARLRPGWCLMQSPTVVVAFAARPEGAETLLAHLEHGRTERPHDTDAALAKIAEELQAIERLATRN